MLVMLHLGIWLLQDIHVDYEAGVAKYWITYNLLLETGRLSEIVDSPYVPHTRTRDWLEATELNLIFQNATAVL